MRRSIAAASGAAVPLLAVVAAAASASIAPERALAAAQAAVAKCAAQGYSVVAVVTAADGTVRVQYAAAASASIDVEAARRKAVTAIVLGMSTVEAERRARKAPGYAEVVRNLDQRVLLIGGGRPVYRTGDLVGAIGVAGAPGGDLDDGCADAASLSLDQPRP